MIPTSLAEPLTLPCGAVLANRIAKAAMSEGYADGYGHATGRLESLYRRWAQSGAGMLLSGNIQVDPWHLERPLNVVVSDDSGFDALRRLATAGTSGGMHFWAQISHTGRQVDAKINPAPLSPSDVQIDVVRGAGFDFAPPRAMTEAEIQAAIAQFAITARTVKAAGFTGVQLHAAHGYLIAQFLSPRSNRRTDRWGGSAAEPVAPPAGDPRRRARGGGSGLPNVHQAQHLLSGASRPGRLDGLPSGLEARQTRLDRPGDRGVDRLGKARRHFLKRVDRSAGRRR